MNRLQAQWYRLYLPRSLPHPGQGCDGFDLVDPDGRVRAMVLELAGPAGWVPRAGRHPDTVALQAGSSDAGSAIPHRHASWRGAGGTAPFHGLRLPRRVSFTASAADLASASAAKDNSCNAPPSCRPYFDEGLSCRGEMRARWRSTAFIFSSALAAPLPQRGPLSRRVGVLGFGEARGPSALSGGVDILKRQVSGRQFASRLGR